MNTSPVPAAPVMLSHDVAGQHLLKVLVTGNTRLGIQQLDLESSMVCG